MIFFLIFCSDSTRNHYPPPEKSDAPEQCKTPTKPFVVKIFYDGNVVLNAGISIENATVTFQKDAGILEIDGITPGWGSLIITENGEERVISFDIDIPNDSPKNVKLQLKIDFINPEYLEKITGQNLFVIVNSSKEFVFYECGGGVDVLEYVFTRERAQADIECMKYLLVPDTIRDFLHRVFISTKKDFSFELEDILLYVYSGVSEGSLFRPLFVEDYDFVECPFLLWRKSWIFNDFCCLLFEGASECGCISSRWDKDICGCGNEVDAVGKRIAVKFGESVIWPGQTVKVGKFVVGAAEATRFKFEGEVEWDLWDSIFGGRKVEKLLDFVSFYMVRVE
jgi:hypothetical protein